MPQWVCEVQRADVEVYFYLNSCNSITVLPNNLISIQVYDLYNIIRPFTMYIHFGIIP